MSHKSHTTRLLTETLHDTPPPHRWAAAASVTTIAICGLVISLIASRPAAPLAARVPPPAIIILATPTMQPPTATPAPQVEAYAAPNGAKLGPIPLPSSYTARYGVQWLQAPWDGGQVWIQVSEVGAIPAGLVDLQPAPTAVIVVVERPVYRTIVEPAPAQVAATAEPTSDWYDTSTLPTADPAIVEACKGSTAVWCH